MRNHYFALDTRPVCPKCRMGYDKRIQYGRGPGSLVRILTWGGGAALAGALLLGIVGFWMGFLRVLCSIAVAWLVAKAINKATGDYYMRRNQIAAVALVWFSVSIAALVPIAIEMARYEPEVQAPATPADSLAVAAEAQEEADVDDLAASLESEPAPTPTRSQSMEQEKAAQLRSGGFLKGLFALVVLFLTLPIISAFGMWGVQAAGVALLGLGFALYRAWAWTSDGVSYELTGPHRIGTGPVSTTF